MAPVAQRLAPLTVHASCVRCAPGRIDTGGRQEQETWGLTSLRSHSNQSSACRWS